jgi:hypothetical protein
MEKEFVSYEIALALKELGFDEPCFAFYTPEKQLIIARGDVLQSSIEDAPITPLYQQAFRWFREKYINLEVIISSVNMSIDGISIQGWQYSVKDRHTNRYYNCLYDNKKHIMEDFIQNIGAKSYEEAELKCLKKLIEIVKDEKRKEIN